MEKFITFNDVIPAQIIIYKLVDYSIFSCYYKYYSHLIILSNIVIGLWQILTEKTSRVTLLCTYIIYPNDGLLIGDAYDDLDLHIPQHSKGPVMPQLLLTSIHSHNSINGNSIQWRIIVTMANTNGDFEQKMWSIVILGRLRSPMIDWIYY